MGSRHVSVLLGAYVLGGLRGREEARVKEHLARCPRCQAEYEDLAELPVLLNLISAEDAAKAQGLAEQVCARNAAHRA